MRILPSYILREFLKIFSLAVGALLSLYLAIDFFENVGEFVQHRVALDDTARFFLLRLPQSLFYMTPVALLLSSVLHFGLLSKHNELVAIRASGVNLFRVISPVLIVSLLMSILIFILNGSLIPSSNQQAVDIERDLVQHKPRDLFFKQNSLWLRVDSRTLYNIAFAAPDQKMLRGVDFYHLSENFQMVERIRADSAVYTNSQWVLKSGTRWLFSEQGEVQVSYFDETPALFPIPLQDFSKIVLKTKEMKFSDLFHYVKKLHQEGYEDRRLSVDLYAKTSFPFSGVVLTLIGTSFALIGLRRGGIALGVGLSLALSFAYWMLFSFALSMGYSGYLPPFFASWSANFLFGGIGLYLMSQIKR